MSRTPLAVRGALAAVAGVFLVAVGSAASGEAEPFFFDGFEDPAAPGSCLTPPPVGYTRNSTYDEFTDLPSVNFLGQFIDDFPGTGSDQGRLVTPIGQYVSLQFTAPPADSPLYPNSWGGVFNFTESQVGGSGNLNVLYITISQCQGDFRIPPGIAAAPPGDTTFANGCRNIDFGASPPVIPSLILRRIDYRTGLATSTSSLCQITPGGTYFFNMILADPRGGIAPPTDGAPCGGVVNGGCGIQLNIE